MPLSVTILSHSFDFVSDYVIRAVCVLDILIRKISLDPIGLHGQGANANYMPKFQVSTMSLEVV